MKSFVMDLWIRIHSGYWFIPLLLVSLALVMAIVAVTIDGQLTPDWVRGISWLYIGHPSAARSILATVAGSMITVAGVTFSLTLLTVSHASAQIGQRLITEVMRDRGNQLTLGVFTATFVYCLVVLRTVREAVDGGSVTDFVPHVAVFLALVLAIASVLVLIYFIHHVPVTLNVSNLLDRLSRDAVARLSDAYPTHIGERRTSPSTPPPDFESDASEIPLDGIGGYLRVVDSEGLVELARSHDAIVSLLVAPGDFLVSGTPVARIHPRQDDIDALSTELCSHLSFGSERTKEQDLAFPIEQICEIAGRALSPGVNDQYTATRCVDFLERIFTHAGNMQPPECQRNDDNGDLRVIVSAPEWVDLVARALPPLRQFVAGDAIASAHLLRMCMNVARRAEINELADYLRGQAAGILDDAQQRLPTNDQKRRLEAIYRDYMAET